ncbi:hypothetical protein JST97_29670 [bacterium]|nr:hypothetical protein [bacterium]
METSFSVLVAAQGELPWQAFAEEFHQTLLSLGADSRLCLIGSKVSESPGLALGPLPQADQLSWLLHQLEWTFQLGLGVGTQGFRALPAHLSRRLLWLSERDLGKAETALHQADLVLLPPGALLSQLRQRYPRLSGKFCALAQDRATQMREAFELCWALT